MHGAHNTCWNAHHTPCQKIHMRSCMRAYATVQKLLCHGSYCKLILSLAGALCRLLYAARFAAPPTVSTKPITRRCSLKKSVQIHASSWRGRRCGAAKALFNHPRWCRPDPVCLWVYSRLAAGVTSSRILFLPFFLTRAKKSWIFGGWISKNLLLLFSCHHCVTLYNARREWIRRLPRRFQWPNQAVGVAYSVTICGKKYDWLILLLLLRKK